MPKYFFRITTINTFTRKLEEREGYVTGKDLMDANKQIKFVEPLVQDVLEIVEVKDA